MYRYMFLNYGNTSYVQNMNSKAFIHGGKKCSQMIAASVSTYVHVLIGVHMYMYPDNS